MDSKTFCMIAVYMSSALLAQLKVKPIPALKKEFNVGVAKGEAAARQLVKINTQIIDKTKDADALLGKDISNIRRKFKASQIVKNLTAASKQAETLAEQATVAVQQEAAKLPAITETEEPKAQDVEEVPEAPVEATPAAPKLTVKKRKLVLKPKITQPETEAQPAETEPVEAEVPKKVTRTIRRPAAMKSKLVQKLTERPRVSEGPLTLLKIGDTALPDRLPENDPEVLIRASSYYMSNRDIFMNFISSLFRKYKEQIESETADVTCESRGAGKFGALAHQSLVRDYLNIYTPYRGLLLYHGLGSGKTCSSIGIAEGLKSHKRVLILTPASLRANFYKELKKCGDPLFRKNQFWEFVKTGNNTELVNVMSRALGIPLDFIKKYGGAWMVNVQKASNYSLLSAPEQRILDEQLNLMIEHKYDFINYNGLRESHLNQLTQNGKINPFDDKVVLIEEAHNFVGRIANKIATKKTKSLSYTLYSLLLSAKSCRVVMLTGTPVVNYPNELGIMFNILRGNIKTFTFKLNVLTERRVNEDDVKRVLSGVSSLDYVQYNASTTTLTVTRNPFGFSNVMGKAEGRTRAAAKGNVYEGVVMGERGEIDDDSFVRILTSTLVKSDLPVAGKVIVNEYKALPDELNAFKTYFLEQDGITVKNVNLFKRRILGLASYFRSAQEQLLPKYNKSIDFHVVKIPMSDYQFSLYEDARKKERKLEENNAKKRRNAKRGKAKDADVYEETVSTYRIFSRAFCNFVFPREIPRPMPLKETDITNLIEETSIDEDILDAKSVDEKLKNPDGRYTAEDEDILESGDKRFQMQQYEQDIKAALADLAANADQFLTPEALETLSPKFLAILLNIQNPENAGCHLVYSQFRTLEGIGILKLILEANGFAHFKLTKSAAGMWDIDVKPEDYGKPMLTLYTGTEEEEEKEILRNIFNGEWNLIPRNISEQIEKMGFQSNNMGELIKVLMITASGAEGIDLKNVRFVHIAEPYWHPVRTEQVIGRAVRICSHAALPEELRTVEVFVYLMELSESQLSDKASYDLRIKDRSKLDNKTAFTTDQAIYEIASIKQDINSQLLKAIKEASVDCVIHSKAGKKEGLKCFSLGSVSPNKFSSTPSLSAEERDAVGEANRMKITWKAKTVTVEGIKYALREDTGEMFDLDSLSTNNPILVGTLVKEGRKYKVTWL
jgi:hypothetical protein